MTIADPIGIDMPADFPIGPYNAVNLQLAKQQAQPSWSEYAAGWNAVARWYHAAAAADEFFTASITKGGAPSTDERQAQDVALYNFFVMGLSVVESFAYAIYAIAAMLQPQTFPMTTPAHLRAIGPAATCQKYTANFPGQPIETSLASLIADASYANWGTIRNVLAHRSSPPRSHALSLPVGGTANLTHTVWQVAGGLALNDRTTADRRQWLSQQISNCVTATESFAKANFP